MQTVQTNARATGLLQPEFTREDTLHVLQSARNQLDMQQSSCFLFFVPRCCSVALELPGVHPPEPCHGAAGVRCHGSYHPIGQRMEEVEAVGRIKMPSRTAQFSVLRTMQHISPYGYETFFFIYYGSKLHWGHSNLC